MGIDWQSAPAWAYGVGEITQFAGLWYIGHDKYAAVEAPEVTLFFKKAVFPMRKNVINFLPRPKQWPEEARIDTIATNGNTGEHYALTQPKTAVEFLNACAAVQSERGKQYDASGTGERSFAAAASAFNAATGKNLTGSDVCLLLTMVKLVRQYSSPDRLHHDSLLDGVSYLSLWAEELSKELSK
jgi:hypothetical protein